MVGSRRQIFKQKVSIAIGDLDSNKVSVTIIQCNGGTWETWLALFFDSVGIEIVPSSTGDVDGDENTSIK